MSEYVITESIREHVIVIPARMHGTRLPGKPLILISGKPMIHHVWDRCASVYSREDIFIATEDLEIKNYCDENGINCVVTPKANSAIDRIFLFSKKIKAKTYINVQGDEPIVNPKDIQKIVEYSSSNRDRVVFGKTKATKSDFEDFSKAKVVCDQNGRLLYSSRAGIPVSNKGEFVEAERAIWIYAFPATSLGNYFDSFGRTRLDEIEDNEILRFLEIGIPVFCVDLIGDSWAVDELKDIEIVESKIRDSQL
jgi:3-deoxy-manno-octulosonate cytidylyltransferase (CMP-KDO synthetase)